MTIKEQFGKLKDNWLLIVVSLILLMFLFGLGNVSTFVSNLGSSTESYERAGTADYDYEPAPMRSSLSTKYVPRLAQEFAPEVKDRLIAKTARMSTEVETSKFKDAATQLKSTITSSSAYLLNEDVNTYETGTKKEYTTGNYQVKVESAKYDSFVSQLKTIGKVLSFNENAQDITGTYVDLQTELENEKKRLQRYQEMYTAAVIMKDKIEITDKMFELESRIKYLEESIANLGKQVSYSTIYVSIREKRAEYSNIEFAKISDLAAAFVGSVSGLVYVIVALLPWALAAWLVAVLVQILRRRNKQSRQANEKKPKN